MRGMISAVTASASRRKSTRSSSSARREMVPTRSSDRNALQCNSCCDFRSGTARLRQRIRVQKDRCDGVPICRMFPGCICDPASHDAVLGDARVEQHRDVVIGVRAGVAARTATEKNDVPDQSGIRATYGVPERQQPGSGIGRQDGSKDLRAAQQEKAMGKLSEVIGKRSANVTGEMTVEVQSGSQQLKTGYTQKSAQHAATGGDLNRDEVPLDMQPYVSGYFDEIRKQPAAKK